MRRYLLLALPMLASGCALPPALVIASYGADGLSYLSSGKSLEDHGISTVLDKDCALHRFVVDEPVCTTYDPPNPGFLFAQATPALPQTGQPAAGVAPPVESAPPQRVAPTAAAPSPPPPPQAPPAPIHDAGAHRYLVLGSFGTRENAVRFANGLGETGIAVVPAAVGGRTVYRVVAGPMAPTKVASLRTRFAGKTTEPAWEVASLSVGIE